MEIQVFFFHLDDVRCQLEEYLTTAFAIMAGYIKVNAPWLKMSWAIVESFSLTGMNNNFKHVIDPLGDLFITYTAL